LKRADIQRPLELALMETRELHSHLTQALALLVAGEDPDFIANFVSAKRDLGRISKLLKVIK
jgi:hypothetical protein